MLPIRRQSKTRVPPSRTSRRDPERVQPAVDSGAVFADRHGSRDPDAPTPAPHAMVNAAILFRQDKQDRAATVSAAKLADLLSEGEADGLLNTAPIAFD